jgi:hypothetical protein
LRRRVVVLSAIANVGINSQLPDGDDIASYTKKNLVFKISDNKPREEYPR